LYGGAAGGGKSSCLLMLALDYVDVPGYAALLLRRTYQDLKKPGALIDRAHQWLSGTAARWNEQTKQWTFPSGATLTFGYLESENDKYNYQGGEYQFCGWDELSQFTESQYTYLFSRLRRLEGSDVPLRMRAATNPGGVGGRWVQERFVPETFTPDQAREYRVFYKEGTDEEGRAFKRAFVPATLDDNPHLDRAEYAESLAELDPVTREQLLRGDWTIRERGDILSQWDERYHVISWSEFAGVYGVAHTPDHWLLDLYQDWGTTPGHPCVTTWFTTASANSALPGKIFVVRGLTVEDWTVRQVAEDLNRLMAPRGEKSRVRRWQMSHEANSERLAYQREHALPFSAWPTGKTRGIAQLRGFHEVIDLDKPNPFRPKLMGCARLMHVVSDAELLYPKTDAGLVRHRAEAPAYKWKTLKSGEDLASLIPHDLFNDAMDTERAACADYGPSMLPKTWKERTEEALPDANKQVNIDLMPPDEQPGAMIKRQMLIRDLVVKDERKNIYDARTRAKLKRRRGR